MIYESKHKPPLPFPQFLLRMAWRDAFVNSAMLLGGMGPMKTDGLSDGGKVFAGLFALYAGLVLIIVIGIMMAPLIHRIMHVFHWEEKGDKD